MLGAQFEVIASEPLRNETGGTHLAELAELFIKLFGVQSISEVVNTKVSLLQFFQSEFLARPAPKCQRSCQESAG